MPYHKNKFLLKNRSIVEFTIKIPPANRFDKMTHEELNEMMEWFAEQEKALKFWKRVMKQEYKRRKSGK